VADTIQSLPRPAADQLAVAERAGSRLVAGWLRRDGERLIGRLRRRVNIRRHQRINQRVDRRVESPSAQHYTSVAIHASQMDDRSISSRFG